MSDSSCILSIWPIFKAAPRIRQRASASRSAFCSDKKGETADCCFPFVSVGVPYIILLADSCTVPHARPAPSPANLIPRHFSI